VKFTCPSKGCQPEKVGDGGDKGAGEGGDSIFSANHGQEEQLTHKEAIIAVQLYNLFLFSVLITKKKCKLFQWNEIIGSINSNFNAPM